MKKLRFSYSMALSFDSDIEHHKFTLKCLPPTNDRQRIEELNFEIEPKASLSRDYDSFGNEIIYGYVNTRHNFFKICVSGIATTGIKSCIYDDSVNTGMYKIQTEYTKPGVVVRAYHDKFKFNNTMSNYDKVYTYMQTLYNDFEYVQGVTDISTTAEQALELGKGVCQDYSHILISLCRLENIPARYVVGYLIGEGYSHAWVEAFCEDGWVAFDPTNNKVVDDEHIKISNGRDYSDCTINQGIFVGGANQTQDIVVKVEEM